MPNVTLGVFELPGAAASLRRVFDALPWPDPMRAAADTMIEGARFVVVSSLDCGRVWRPADEREICILLSDACSRAGRDGQVEITKAVEPETLAYLDAWIERLGSQIQ